MRDLDHELEQLSNLSYPPLAEPEPIDGLRRRTRKHRTRRALAGATACVVAAAAVGVTLASTNDAGAPDGSVDVAAPQVLLSDIEAAVVSSTFTETGERASIPAEVVDQVAAVDGVASATGALHRFAVVSPAFDFVTGDDPLTEPPLASDGESQLPLDADEASGEPPRTPVLISIHEPDQITMVEGEYPDATGEIVINAEAATRYELGIGDEVVLSLGDEVPRDVAANTFTVTGIFQLAEGDVEGAPVAAIPTQLLPTEHGFDRVDFTVEDGADRTAVINAVNDALADELVAYDATQLGTAEEVRAELEIQRAFWWLISPDIEERLQAQEAYTQDPAENERIYERVAGIIGNVEIRVARVSFLSAERADVVVQLFYNGAVTNVSPQAQSAEAVFVDGRWRLSNHTVCKLAALVAEDCGIPDVGPIAPPAGWESVDSVPGVADALNALADAAATVDSRVAAVVDGERFRDVIADGLADDQSYTSVRFVINGVREVVHTDPSGNETTYLEVLYGLAVDGPAPLATPEPLTLFMIRGADGTWRVPPQYSCGLQGLATADCVPLGEMP